jgi:hypothetical protein
MPTAATRIPLALAVTLVSVIALAGCADRNLDEAAPVPEQRVSIRGDRYCEFLLLSPGPQGLSAEVYSTFPLNDCPSDLWTMVDPVQVAQQAGVPVSIANGPRYWAIDGVKRTTTDDVVRRQLGGLDMNRYATVVLSDPSTMANRYMAQSVDRRAVMSFVAGQPVYVLVDPSGAEYAMQSWSQQVDPTLSEADLALLGERLMLPEGWRYEVRVPDTDLVIDFGDQLAKVLQDDLFNSYSLIPRVAKPGS